MYYDEIVKGMLGVAKGIIRLENDGQDEDRFLAIEEALAKHFNAEIVQDYGELLQELDAGELDFELDKIQFVVFVEDNQSYLLCDHQDLDLYDHIRAVEFDIKELGL